MLRTVGSMAEMSLWRARQITELYTAACAELDGPRNPFALLGISRDLAVALGLSELDHMRVISAIMEIRRRSLI